MQLSGHSELSIPNFYQWKTKKYKEIKADSQEMVSLGCFQSHILDLDLSLEIKDLTKIYDVVKEHFRAYENNILYYLPKGFQGLNRSIFVNGFTKRFYIPLNHESIGKGGQNTIKKAIHVQLGNTPQEIFISLVAQKKRLLGFTPEEKNLLPNWKKLMEQGTSEALGEFQILDSLLDVPDVEHVLDRALYTGKHKRESVEKMIIFEPLFQTDLFNVTEKRKFPMSDLLALVKRISKALVCLHSRNIVHQDLKRENILVSVSTHQNGTVFELALADFGHAKYTNICYSSESQGGTYSCWPPEVFKRVVIEKNPYSTSDSPSSDLWTLGVLIHELFFGWVEWEIEVAEMVEMNKNRRHFAYNIMSENCTFIEEKREVLREIDENMMKRFEIYQEKIRKFEKAEPSQDDLIPYLLSKLLRLEPDQRMKAEEVVAILEHNT